MAILFTLISQLVNSKTVHQPKSQTVALMYKKVVLVPGSFLRTERKKMFGLAPTSVGVSQSATDKLNKSKAVVFGLAVRGLWASVPLPLFIVKAAVPHSVMLDKAEFAEQTSNISYTWLPYDNWRQVHFKMTFIWEVYLRKAPSKNFKQMWANRRQDRVTLAYFFSSSWMICLSHLNNILAEKHSANPRKPKVQ